MYGKLAAGTVPVTAAGISGALWLTLVVGGFAILAAVTALVRMAPRHVHRWQEE
jgi:hypothetical protein